MFIVLAPVCGDQIHEEDLMKRSAVITAQPRASGAPTPSAPEVEDTEDERYETIHWASAQNNESPF